MICFMGLTYYSNCRISYVSSISSDWPGMVMACSPWKRLGSEVLAHGTASHHLKRINIVHKNIEYCNLSCYILPEGGLQKSCHLLCLFTMQLT